MFCLFFLFFLEFLLYIFHFTIEEHFRVSNFEALLLVLQSLRDVAIVSFCQLHVRPRPHRHTKKRLPALLLLLKKKSSSWSSTYLFPHPPLFFPSSIQFVTVRIAADLESRIMTRSPRQQGQLHWRRRRSDETVWDTHTHTHTTRCPLLHGEEKTDGQEWKKGKLLRLSLSLSRRIDQLFGLHVDAAVAGGEKEK